jgi:minor extracellular serine protease Vpr
MLLRIIMSALLLQAGISLGQVKMSAATKHDLQLLSAQWKKQGEAGFADLSAQYPVYRMQGTYVVSAIARTNAIYSKTTLAARHIVAGAQIGDIVTLKIPLDQLGSIADLPGIALLEMAGKVQPHLDKAVKDVRADSVHAGINLPQAYTGQHVYIGITDWGFDYTHPMFYDTAMTETRIAAAWDQYKQSGPTPAGYEYGTEYQTPAELLAAGSDTANIYSYNYHGSHVAGIAGGGGAGTNYRGVAFESQFLFATFLVDAGAVLDAYAWMYTKSVAAHKRLVINQSWGLHHIGNLDGTSLLSQAIDNYSDLGVVFVTSGGNNGDVNFHISKTFAADTLKTKVSFYPYSANPNMYGESLTLWGEPEKSFAVGIKVLNGSNTLLSETPFYNTASTPDYVDSYILVGASDTVFYNVSAEAANPYNNRPHMRFRVKCTNTAYKVVLHVGALEGTVHAWNVVELTNDVGNWGLPFASLGVGYTAGNKDYGIGEPACTESVLAVGAYTSSYYSGPNLVGGNVATFSSFGPTLDGRLKPDISAPGVSIASSVSSFTDSDYTPLAQTVDFGIRTYHFTRISGTSMSSPMVAGIVALILEANPTLSSWQVKEIIRQTARTDNYTGVIPAGGSMRWGWGKINAYMAVKLALETTSVQEVSAVNYWNVYPNPTTDDVFVAGLTGNESYELLSLDGKLLQSGSLKIPVLDLRDLHPGMYLIIVHDSRGKQAFQVIKQ